MPKQKQQNALAPWLLMIGGSLIILGVVIWQTTKILTPLEPTPIATAGSNNVYLPYPDVGRILLEDAKAAYDEGSALFIDVRDEEYHARGHISGSLNIPYSLLETSLDDLDPKQQIITYCT